MNGPLEVSVEELRRLAEYAETSLPSEEGRRVLIQRDTGGRLGISLESDSARVMRNANDATLEGEGRTLPSPLPGVKEDR